MKQTSKRLQALVLVLAMCVSFLQIPSFAAADDETHTNVYSVSKVSIEKDGSFTIAEKCSNHKDATKACNEVTGLIATKVDEVKGTILDTANSKVPTLKCNKEVEISIVPQAATCSEAGKLTYVVSIDGVDSTRSVENGTATGKHDYLPAAGMDYDALISNKNFSLVSDAATCDADGDAVFAQKCTRCGHVNEDKKALVKVKHSVGHTYIKDEADKTGQTDKTYTEELAAPTCKNEGLAIKYKVCKFCKDKFYIKADGELTTAKSQAQQNIVPKLNHTLKYTVSPKQSYQDVGDKDFTENDFKVDYECTACKGENVYDEKAKPVKAELVADKTDTPKFNCTVGSRTYKVTYEFTDYTKKNTDGSYATGTADQEVTVKYYPAQLDNHKYGAYVRDEDSVVKATCTKDGSYNMVKICSVCGDKVVYATIPIPAAGKHTAAAAKKENVVAATTKKGGSYDLVVRCADCGKVLSKTHKTTAKIVVKASYVTKVKNYSGKKAKVYLKKASSISGYQIQYATNKSYKSAKYVNTKATSKYLTKLSKNKKYYVRVRTYKVISGKVYYSSWSGSKTVTIKK